MSEPTPVASKTWWELYQLHACPLCASLTDPLLIKVVASIPAHWLAVPTQICSNAHCRAMTGRYKGDTETPGMLFVGVPDEPDDAESAVGYVMEPREEYTNRTGIEVARWLCPCCGDELDPDSATPRGGS